REAEDALLQEGITPVPEGQGEAEGLAFVADPGQAVLAPAIGAGACLVVREVVPGVAVRAVVLSNGAPGALAQVGAPVPPGRAPVRHLEESLTLCAHMRGTEYPGGLTDQLRYQPVVELRRHRAEIDDRAGAAGERRQHLRRQAEDVEKVPPADDVGAVVGD